MLRPPIGVARASSKKPISQRLEELSAQLAPALTLDVPPSGRLRQTRRDLVTLGEGDAADEGCTEEE